MKNNNDDILLSIVIPVYNRQKSFDLLLADISKAIVNNYFEQQVEVIVIDDASTTPLVISKYCFEVVLNRNSRNSGAPFSRSKGLQLSHGKFIHFHDSDDSISDTWLFELLKELSDNLEIDMLVTGRIDSEYHGKTYRYPKFFNKQSVKQRNILGRLIYWNCIGPIGGVTFSRQALQKITIRKMASCQDWQMYIDIIKSSKELISRPNIKFHFNKTGNDRISYNAQKKILGHLQLSRQTEKESIFGRKIRLFYLYACKQHIFNKGGIILKFYKQNRITIIATYLVIAAYSFLPKFKNNNGI